MGKVDMISNLIIYRLHPQNYNAGVSFHETPAKKVSSNIN